MPDANTKPLNYFNYFTEIEETFIRRRGKNLLLSPIDWAMIEGWQERGIPLHIVIRGIESVFDAWEKKKSPRTIKGLLYCREEIEGQYQEWLAMQAGRGDQSSEDGAARSAFSRESIVAHIDKAIAGLEASTNEALREDFRRACLRLEELKAALADDFETIDKSLCDIEHFLNHALLTKSDPQRLKELKGEIKAELKAYKSSMEPDAYKQTFDLMMLKRLRELEGIPRLGLFYL